MDATIVCPQCKGAKEIEYPVAPGQTAAIECPTCAGEGVVDEAEAFVYAQEQKVACSCVGGADRYDVIDGQKRCCICGGLVEEEQ